MKEKATTMAKIQAMRTFFVIGILEQFEDTLKVFETILPSYYSGVLDIWQSDSKYFLKAFQTKAILFLKSLSERVGTDIERL